MEWRDGGPKRLADAFRERGWGAKASFARQANISASTISRWLAGSETPTADHVLALCQFFDWDSADHLLGLDTSRPQTVEEAMHSLELLNRKVEAETKRLHDLIRKGTGQS